MQTFEEFFSKKKIDLKKLQKGEPILYSEFKEGYELMGAKSFDHSKKFWFNKLRLKYHLEEETKIEAEAPKEKKTYIPKFKIKTSE